MENIKKIVKIRKLLLQGRTAYRHREFFKGFLVVSDKYMLALSSAKLEAQNVKKNSNFR